MMLIYYMQAPKSSLFIISKFILYIHIINTNEIYLYKNKEATSCIKYQQIIHFIQCKSVKIDNWEAACGLHLT